MTLLASKLVVHAGSRSAVHSKDRELQPIRWIKTVPSTGRGNTDHVGSRPVEPATETVALLVVGIALATIGMVNEDIGGAARIGLVDLGLMLGVGSRWFWGSIKEAEKAGRRGRGVAALARRSGRLSSRLWMLVVGNLDCRALGTVCGCLSMHPENS